MVLHLKYFASLAEIVGRDSESIDIDPSTDLDDLWRLLIERHPSLGDLGYRPLAACDMEYAGWGRSLDGVKEVAFLPPVSGG